MRDTMLSQDVRTQFPFFDPETGARTTYLDSAATSQKPRSVIDRIARYYATENANVRRGAYRLSHLVSEAYENVRTRWATSLGVSPQQLIFTRGTTEAINLLAHGVGETGLSKDDVVAVTRMEHHGNFVPWQYEARRTGARFEIVELNADGTIDRVSLARVLELKPKILAIAAASNVLGTINPIAETAAQAKLVGTRVVVDAAQMAPHAQVQIQAMGPIDALTFSSHKCFGPTGTGLLWVRQDWLEELPPYQKGGDMIAHVGDYQTQWNDLPARFEAGTPSIASVLGFGAALEFIEGIGWEKIQEIEEALSSYLRAGLESLSSVTVVGPPRGQARVPLYSFSVVDIHPHDMATFLDHRGIAVRSGHHCTQPLHRHLGVPGTVRASLAVYNNRADIDHFVKSVDEAIAYFRGRMRTSVTATTAHSGVHL